MSRFCPKRIIFPPFCIIFLIIFIAPLLPAGAQDVTQQDLLKEAAQVYGVGGDNGSGGLLGGFDAAGLIGALIFSGVGFIAFVYGKKMQEYKTLGIGLALLIYPYFVRNTLAVYIVGIVLCVCLYFFRE